MSVPDETAAMTTEGKEVGDVVPTRLCPECRVGKHTNCTGWAVNSDDQIVPCPCYRCNPPAPQRCSSCGHTINPQTGECAGCSD